MRLRRLLAERFARKRAWQVSPTPIVSVTFDDFPRSALTVGGRLLTEYGWRGTYYGALGLMGTTCSDGTMFTRADLDVLLEPGHELACHTFAHVSCLSVSTNEFISACAQNRSAAATLLGGYQLRNFSFPHGHITLAAKRLLRCEYDTCRSIEWGINSDPVDLNFLRANPIYSRLPIERLQQLITINARTKGWLVLYTHDVDIDPSPYGCTPEYFQEVLGFVRDSGAEVLTIGEGASRYALRRAAGSMLGRAEPETRVSCDSLKSAP